MAAIAQIDLKQFWQMSPFLFGLSIEGYNKRVQSDLEVMRWKTWHVAALGRVKKMPDLKEFVQSKTKRDKVPLIDEDGIKASLKAYGRQANSS
jgi:hypothetical protein